MKKMVKSRLVAVHKTKVLVLRKVGKPLEYTLPGGIQKKNETEAEALVREVREEIKLKMKKVRPQFYLSHIRQNGRGSVTRNYFITYLKPLPIKVKETHKFEEACWMEWKEAAPFMDKSDRAAVKTYFKSLGRKLKREKAYGSQISPRLAM
ncbi:MAG: NUDIX hydrolase [Allomuricauda sp.]